MCGDCERSMDEIVQNKPGCRCKSCNAPGAVIAVERPVGSAERGLAPWCVACHHFLLTGHARSQ